MSLNRIKAILLQELFITIRSVEVINDLFLYPIFVNIIIFGLLTIYLNSVTANFDATQVLIGMIFWQPVWIVSYSISLGALWNVWSKNLTNMFITPISLAEYFTAYGLSGVLKGLFVLVISYILSIAVFNIDVLSIGILSSLLFFINVSLSGLSLGIFVLGLIFRFGTRIQALGWGLIGVIQPLMAVVYPVRILPQPFQVIAWLFPPTYIFEAARASLNGRSDISDYIINALLLNCIYLVLSLSFFNYMFRKSKEVGQFAKLES